MIFCNTLTPDYSHLSLYPIPTPQESIKGTLSSMDSVAREGPKQGKVSDSKGPNNRTAKGCN